MDNITGTDYKLPGDRKSKKKKKPTLRFELDLPESTVTSCPEYSYIDLLRENLKERESKGQNDSLCQNLLEEEEEKERNEAKALAEYYEIKFGATAAGQKHKRKDKGRDLVGAGYGYDENDPFVDDSVAYDEIVPASLTTQHGGFYINIGKLNFRTVSDDSDTGNTSSDDSIPLSHVTKKKKAVHMLNTDESESEFQTIDGVAKKKKKKLKSVKDPATRKRKMSLNGKEKVPGLKQRSKKIKKPTTLAQKLIAKAKAQQMMNASGVGNSVHPSNGAIPQYRKVSEDRLVVKSKTGELGHLENKDLAQVAKQFTKELMSVGSSKIVSEPDQNFENGLSSATSSTSAPKIYPVVNHELPPNLPQKLGDKIESLKMIAKSTEVPRKMKFFSSDVNQILLGIEKSAQGLRNKERQGMYQHIAQHLPCSKDTLLKRVKKLQEGDSDQQLKGPVQRLKSAVDAVMTLQIEAYVLECESKSEKFPHEKTAPSTDEDEENEERNLDGTAGEKAKRKPRRKFRWDDNLRKLLCDIVTVKMNLYERFKLREKQNAEEYLKAFLESTIKPLWPKPWMQTRILFKESRSAHERLTLNCQKQKKAGSNKKVPSMNKDSSKLDLSSSQPPVTTLQSSAVQSEIAPRISKKLLILNATDPKNPLASGTTAEGNSGVIDLTSGGFELVASIEGEDFDDPKVATSLSKGAARTTPKDLQSSWKPVPYSNNKTSKSAAKLSSPLFAPLSATGKADKKGDAKEKPAPGTSNGGHDPFSMEPKLIQDYASDFVKMMMAPGQLPQGTPGYLEMQGVTNYETISKMLGLKPDAVPKTTGASSQCDDKFQFKISSTPTISASKLGHSTSKGGFAIMDPGKKRVPLALDPSSWMRQKSSIQKISPDKDAAKSFSQKTHSSAQNFPVRSIPSSLSEGFIFKHPTAPSSPVISPSFAFPSVDGSTAAQRQKKSVSPGNIQPHKVAKSGFDAAAILQKLASSAYNSPKQEAPSLTDPQSRPSFHHSRSPSVQSSVSQINPTVTGLPAMGLSPRSGQYSLAGVGNSFSPALTTPQGLYFPKSKFKAPQSPVHKYPSVPDHPFRDPSFTNDPLVQLDVQSNKDLIKQANINVQVNGLDNLTPFSGSWKWKKDNGQWKWKWIKDKLIQEQNI